MTDEKHDKLRPRAGCGAREVRSDRTARGTGGTGAGEVYAPSRRGFRSECGGAGAWPEPWRRSSSWPWLWPGDRASLTRRPITNHVPTSVPRVAAAPDAGRVGSRRRLRKHISVQRNQSGGAIGAEGRASGRESQPTPNSTSFPSPQPLSEQKKLALAQYVSSFPSARCWLRGREPRRYGKMRLKK